MEEEYVWILLFQFQTSNYKATMSKRFFADIFLAVSDFSERIRANANTKCSRPLGICCGIEIYTARTRREDAGFSADVGKVYS